MGSSFQGQWEDVLGRGLRREAPQAVIQESQDGWVGEAEDRGRRQVENGRERWPWPGPSALVSLGHSPEFSPKFWGSRWKVCSRVRLSRR